MKKIGKQVLVILPESLIRALNRMAYDEDTSRSDVIRRLLEDGVERYLERKERRR